MPLSNFSPLLDNNNFSSSELEMNFKEELKLFSQKPHLLGGYLVVKKKEGNLRLFQANIVEVAWQKFKSLFGFFNGADPHLIKLKTLEFLLKGKEWGNTPEHSPLVKVLAERAGLFSCSRNSSQEEEKLIRDMQHVLFSKEVDDAPIEEINLFNRFVIQYQQKLEPFTEEINKIKTIFKHIFLEQDKNHQESKSHHISFNAAHVIDRKEPLNLGHQSISDTLLASEKKENNIEHAFKVLAPKECKADNKWSFVAKISAIFIGAVVTGVSAYLVSTSYEKLQSLVNSEEVEEGVILQWAKMIKSSDEDVLSYAAFTDKLYLNSPTDAAKMFEKINGSFDWKAYEENHKEYISKQMRRALKKIHPDRCSWSMKEKCHDLHNKLENVKTTLLKNEKKPSMTFKAPTMEDLWYYKPEDYRIPETEDTLKARESVKRVLLCVKERKSDCFTLVENGLEEILKNEDQVSQFAVKQIFSDIFLYDADETKDNFVRLCMGKKNPACRLVLNTYIKDPFVRYQSKDLYDKLVWGCLGKEDPDSQFVIKEGFQTFLNCLDRKAAVRFALACFRYTDPASKFVAEIAESQLRDLSIRIHDSKILDEFLRGVDEIKKERRY